MRTDTNTRANHHWFYFCVKNKNKGTFKFNILNFTKNNSLYKQGMRIAIFSKRKSILAESGNIPIESLGWHYDGDKIIFDVSKLSSQTCIASNLLYYRLMAGSLEKIYYCLSFEYTFEYTGDEVYFAYSIPYIIPIWLKI